MTKSDDNETERDRDDRRLEYLIACLGQKDAESLEAFYTLTSAAVFGLALSIVQNHHDAEDVTHDTYVKIYQAAGTYEARGKPLAWVYTITKNLALMKIRERKKNVQYVEDSGINIADTSPDYTIEEKIVIQGLLQELKAEEREIVILRAVFGWKHKEIATLLKRPVQNIIVKYNRALKKLIRIYEQPDGDPF